MQDIAPLKSGFLVTKSWGTTWRVDQYDAHGGMVRTVRLPSQNIGISGIASNDAQDSAIVEYSGWAGPVSRWVAYDATSGAVRTVYNLDPPSQRFAEIRVHELSAISKDGTRIPVTVLSLAGTPQNGSAPAMLTGYGGFDLPTSPRYIGTNFAWLEMGGILAYANIRGGNEFGEQWHQEGKLTNKQNVFDDFYASAQALVSSKWTTASRLGIIGGSNGGLLVGAALVQHPKEYRAVVGAAGIYDIVRHHLFPNGAYNVAEYGSTENPQQFRALAAYSPYYNVKKGVAYPAVLLVTSENDPRVAPWQTWKFGAALEASTSSGRPVVVLTRRSGGHGHGASFAQRVGNAAVGLSFMAAQLGVKP
jgi:prolyl oligopeptidase